MSVFEMSVDKMSVDEMSVDEMSVDKMSVDEMSVDEIIDLRIITELSPHQWSKTTPKIYLQVYKNL